MKTMTLTKKMAMSLQLGNVWQLLTVAYKDVEGGLHFNSPQEIINSTVRWHVVFHQNKPIAITICKAKSGFKMVALAICQQSKVLAKKALRHIIIKDWPCVWMEVSEAAEQFVINHCRGEQYKIQANNVPALIGKTPTSIADDGFHYVRTIMSLNKTKIALGTPSLVDSI